MMVVKIKKRCDRKNRPFHTPSYCAYVCRFLPKNEMKQQFSTVVVTFHVRDNMNYPRESFITFVDISGLKIMIFFFFFVQSSFPHRVRWE